MTFPSTVNLPWVVRRNDFPAVAQYGSSGTSVITSGTYPATATAFGRLTYTNTNQINATGSLTSGTPSGFTNPAGIAWYLAGTGAKRWIYFNRISQTLVIGAIAGSSASTTTGGVWLDAAAASQFVQASATAVIQGAGDASFSSAVADYDIYTVVYPTQPVGGVQGTFIGHIRVSTSARATSTA